MNPLMATAERIERILLSELDRTHRLYKAEAANFRSVVRDIPSGIPRSDSDVRIRRVADKHNHALDAYKTALRRFNDYAINRIVPDDLEP